MMNVVDNALVSSDIGNSLFVNSRREIFGGLIDASHLLRSATINFTSGGVARVQIRAKANGAYAGERGNHISFLFYRMSADRFAIQSFFRDGTQNNGNVTSNAGMTDTVTKFNADADFNSDFEAFALTADVDVAFSAGTGYANSTPLTGGAG